MAEKDITFTINTNDNIGFDLDNQVTDYRTLIHKPSINGQILAGNVTLNDLGLNAIATNTKLGQVIIKENGGIIVDSDGYISVEEYIGTTTETDSNGNVIVTTPINEHSVVTTVLNSSGTELWSEISKDKNTPGILISGEKVITNTNTVNNSDDSTTTTSTVLTKTPGIEQKVTTITTTGIILSDGSTRNITTILTEKPEGSTKKVTTITVKALSDGNTQTVTETTLLSGISPLVDIGNMEGTKTTTTVVKDSSGTIISSTNKVEDISETDGIPWIGADYVQKLFE